MDVFAESIESESHEPAETPRDWWGDVHRHPEFADGAAVQDEDGFLRAMQARDAADAPDEETLRTCGHMRPDETVAAHFPVPAALPPEPFAALSARQRANVVREEDTLALCAAAREGETMPGVEVHANELFNHLRTARTFARRPAAAALYPAQPGGDPALALLAFVYPVNRQMRYHAMLVYKARAPDIATATVIGYERACTYVIWPATYYICFYACGCVARDAAPPLGAAGAWPLAAIDT